MTRFQVICEVEPPTRPDLTRLRGQLSALGGVADRFLVPDCHIGRATVSSIAVAHEVAAFGGTAIACLNARDRNLLGFRRDLLTAATYGVRDLLFVYGDRSADGRAGDLTVRAMLDEVRAVADDPVYADVPPFRVAAAAGPGALPGWKHGADSLFAQISFSLDPLLRWRESLRVDVPVYAGVMVLASDEHAKRIATSIPDLDIPGALVDRLGGDRLAGVHAACEHVHRIRESGAFDGVHLIPVGRYREVAEHLPAALG